MIGISDDSARRIARVVRRDEQRPFNSVRDPQRPERGLETHPVKITSTTTTAGRYPGTLYQRDGNGDTFTQLGTSGDIWIDTPNGETLVTDRYYYARVTGVRSADSRLIFEVLSAFPILSTATVLGVLNPLTTIASGVTTNIQWTNVVEDTDSYFSPASPERFTVPRTGTYLCTLRVNWRGDWSGINGTRFISFTSNSSGEEISETVSAGGPATVPATTCWTDPIQSICGTVRVNAGSFIYASVRQTTTFTTSALDGGRFSIVEAK